MRGHIIIITPGFRRSLKIPVGRPFQVLLGMPVLALMLGLTFMGVTFPREIHDAEYSRMVEENRTLLSAKETAAIEAGRLSMSIARMEQLSNRITAEISSD
jgi:hypothetical protein